MTTTHHTTTTTTARKRWKMYSSARRHAARIRAGRTLLNSIDAECMDRAARDWASPFLCRVLPVTRRLSPLPLP